MTELFAVGAEIVVDEDGIGLMVGRELTGDLLRMPPAVGHPQAVRREVAEAAAAMTAAGSDKAGCREEAFAGQDRAAGRRILPVVVIEVGVVTGAETSRFDIGQDGGPELHTVADGKGIRMRRAFIGAGNDMQAAEDHLAAAGALPCR